MSYGYTTHYSVETIEQLLEDGFFNEQSHRQYIQQTINDLGTHLLHNAISHQRYDHLISKLKEF